ncbi:MAG: response regulator, partial [Acidobacteriota bacterium]|nr:response regulator [Acidobacteriota bacterium]
MPQTLLLADDSVTIRRVIELTFSDENVRVVSVSNGRDALERIDRERPDIILADAGMADVNGYDISAHVKGSPDLRHIPVVLLAGAFEPLDEARARRCGSDGVLVKPFEPQMVVARVRELLSPPAKPAPVHDAAMSQGRALHQMPPQTGVRPPSGHMEAGSDRRETRELTSAPAGAGDLGFDASLDRLDAAFSETGTPVPKLHADVATDFANDLRDLRSKTDSGGFDPQEFGDWDLPPRPAPDAQIAGQPEYRSEPPAAFSPAARFDEQTREPLPAFEPFGGMDSLEAGLDVYARPNEPAIDQPAAPAPPAPPPVTLPPPVMLRPRPVA